MEGHPAMHAIPTPLTVDGLSGCTEKKRRPQDAASVSHSCLPVTRGRAVPTGPGGRLTGAQPFGKRTLRILARLYERHVTARHCDLPMSPIVWRGNRRPGAT